ncbi:MAG TPA: hypothetical protein VGC21_12860 [Telluria sp.]
MQPIIVRHRINPFQASLVVLIVFGGLSALLVGAHRQLTDAAPSDLVWACYLFAELAAGCAATVLLTLRDRERSTWTLSETDLIGGVRHPVHIPLASITAISAGVPARTKAARDNPWRQSGLVLQIADCKILALSLAGTQEGASLMQALLERCAAVHTSVPVFSASELAVLHRLKWNRVIDMPVRANK